MSVVEGWENKKLIDLAYFINGYAFKPDDWGKEGLPIIRIEQLKNPSAISDYYVGNLPDSNIIDNDDLIFSWSASLFLKIWKHGKAALNQHLFKVIEKHGFDRLFIKYLIEFYLPEFTKSAHGSTMQHITRKELERFSVFIPLSQTEQIKIAEVLSSIDKAIEQTEAIIAKQQRIKTGLMQDLLSKGIDEHGNIRNEQTHAFKDSPLGRIPVEWEIAPISKYGAKNKPYLKTGPFGSALNTKHWTIEGVPVFTIGSLGEGVILENELLYVSEETAKSLNAFRVFSGDIVFSRVADIGRALVVTEKESGWIISSNFMRISLDQSLVNPLFLYRNIVFNHKIHSQLKNISNTGGRDLVNSAILSELIFPWALLDEQNRIEKRISAFENTQIALFNQLKKLQRIKTALMQDLLSGKVRVNQLL